MLVASVRSGTVLASSRMDSLLAKTEPMNNPGCSSDGILKKWKKNARQQLRDMRENEMNSPTDTKVSEGEERATLGTRAETALQPEQKAMAEQAVLQPMEDHIRAAILPTALGGHCSTAGGCTTLKEAAAHGTPAEEGSHQELSP